MNVKELIKLLQEENPYATVIVGDGKYGFKEARILEKGNWNKQYGSFNPDGEGFGEENGTNNSIILE